MLGNQKIRGSLKRKTERQCFQHDVFIRYSEMLTIFFFYGNTALDAFVSTKNSAFSVPRIVLRAFSVKNKRFLYL